MNHPLAVNHVVYEASSNPTIFLKGDELYILVKQEECGPDTEVRTYMKYPYGWYQPDPRRKT